MQQGGHKKVTTKITKVASTLLVGKRKTFRRSTQPYSTIASRLSLNLDEGALPTVNVAVEPRMRPLHCRQIFSLPEPPEKICDALRMSPPTREPCPLQTTHSWFRTKKNKIAQSDDLWLLCIIVDWYRWRPFRIGLANVNHVTGVQQI